MKSLHRFCLCAAAFILSGFVASAQDLVASGTVVDKTYGEPVIGAAVLALGTDLGTITDIDGKFEIKVPAGTMLQFSSVGMKSVTFEAAEGMNVILEDDVRFLEEVVVTGYMEEG